MKKIYVKVFAILALLSSSTLSFAQAGDGDILIEPYYGYSLGKDFLKNFERDDALSVDLSGFGPVGLRAMFYTSDNFSMGVDVNFRTNKF